MKSSKLFGKILSIFVTFIAVLSFSSQTYALELTPEKIQELKDASREVPSFELAITELSLGVGDFIMEYLTFLLKEEVTVQKIIFNEVDALNANFFEEAANPNAAPATQIIKETVNYWYELLGKIVIVVYLIALIAVRNKNNIRWCSRKSTGTRIIG